MAFVNGPVNIDKFLGQVRTRLESEGKLDPVFFDTTLTKEFSDVVRRTTFSEWDGSVNAGDFDDLYPLAAGILRGAASRLYSEAHSDIYQTADAVSAAFADELNATFQTTEDDVFEPIKIRSWAEIMADAGLVTLEGGIVRPTPLTDEIAQSVRGEREI